MDKLMRLGGAFAEIGGCWISLTEVENFENVPAVVHRIRLDTNGLDFWEMMQAAAESMARYHNSRPDLALHFTKIADYLKAFIDDQKKDERRDGLFMDQ